MFACTECSFIERKHHSRDVFPDSGRNIPFASGATVFYNLIDLKIKNTTNTPIKINLRTTSTQLRGSLSSVNKKDSYIKIEEKNPCFIKSKNTGLVYRCNQIYKVFYTKENNKKIKEENLWTNVARVIYDERLIKDKIIT
jgi:vancomycin resistance protein VanW